MEKLKVLIAGAGLGGLCLAQSLRKAGIEVEVYERDSSPWDRPQGYRLHLEADALNALRKVLPAKLHKLFEATAMRTQPFTTVLKTDLSVVKRIPTDDGQDAQFWPEYVSEEKIHCNVDRATLREIMLLGIEDVCHFGMRLAGYESSADAVLASFVDGTAATGHILVGADGIRSTVRQQRAPWLTTMDAGVQAIYGRVAYETARKFVARESLEDIFSIAMDEHKQFLGIGAVKFPSKPEEAAQRIMPSANLKPQSDLRGLHRWRAPISRCAMPLCWAGISSKSPTEHRFTMASPLMSQNCSATVSMSFVNLCGWDSSVWDRIHYRMRTEQCGWDSDSPAAKCSI